MAGVGLANWHKDGSLVRKSYSGVYAATGPEDIYLDWVGG